MITIQFIWTIDIKYIVYCQIYTFQREKLHMIIFAFSFVFRSAFKQHQLLWMPYSNKNRFIHLVLYLRFSEIYDCICKLGKHWKMKPESLWGQYIGVHIRCNMYITCYGRAFYLRSGYTVCNKPVCVDLSLLFCICFHWPYASVYPSKHVWHSKQKRQKKTNKLSPANRVGILGNMRS